MRKIATEIRKYLKREGYSSFIQVKTSKELIIIDNLPPMVSADVIAELATKMKFIYITKSITKYDSCYYYKNLL